MTKKKATSKLHYFPWYYLDWLSSSNVTMMTYEEKGLYTDMISRCYKDNGLPNDEESLQRLFNGCSTTALTTVQRMFYVDGNDRLQHEKLDKIKKDQGVMIKNASNAGKASAAKRKERKIKELGNATAVEIPLNGKATIKTEQNKANKETNKKVCVDISFEDFYELYPKKVEKKSAEMKWGKLKPDEQAEAIRVVKIYPWPEEKRYIPNPSKWLHGERWKDDLTPIPVIIPPNLRSNHPQTNYNEAGHDGSFVAPAEKEAIIPATEEEIAKALEKF